MKAEACKKNLKGWPEFEQLFLGKHIGNRQEIYAWFEACRGTHNNVRRKRISINRIQDNN